VGPGPNLQLSRRCYKDSNTEIICGDARRRDSATSGLPAEKEKGDEDIISSDTIIPFIEMYGSIMRS
jgi:hypothetical protein